MKWTVRLEFLEYYDSGPEEEGGEIGRSASDRRLDGPHHINGEDVDDKRNPKPYVNAEI